MRFGVLAVCAAMLMLMAGVQTQAAVKYVVTDLGAFGPTDINNHGAIVGGSPTIPLMYQNGTFTRLTGMNAAYAVNDLGHVVGDEFLVGGHMRAVMWNNGQITRLYAPPGRPYSTAYGVNSSDRVVGTWDDLWANNVVGGFVWENGVNTDTGYGKAYGVNEHGDYVGGADTSGSAYVVRDGQVTFLTLDPAPKASCAYAINDMGQAAVQANYGGGVRKAYLWDLTTGGTVEIRQPGSYSDVLPRAINNSGVVVGNSYGYPATRAFVWSNGTFEYLASLVDPSDGWVFYTAMGINDQGQIVGSGEHNGKSAGYLLTPVPEPSALISLLCGIGGCGIFLRRRLP